MRLSTSQISRQNLNAILDMQSKVAELDLKIASGKRLVKPSDDPTGSVRVLNLSSEIAKTDQYDLNINAARTQISQEESILAQQGNTLQRIRELVVQANNDTLNDSNREVIATEIESLRDQMLALANTKDASGEYIFSGYQVTNEPFTRVNGQVEYNGDQGQRFVQIGSGTQIAMRDNGYDVFQNIKTGNGTFTGSADPANSGAAVMASSIAGDFVPDSYAIQFSQATLADPITYEIRDGSSGLVSSGTFVEGEAISFNGVRASFTGLPVDGDSFTVETSPTRDIFSTIDGIASSIRNASGGSSNQTRLHNELSGALSDIDQGMDHLLNVRAEIGVRLNGLDAQLNVNEISSIQLQQSLSSLQDLDYAKAVNEMNQQLTALKAAQEIYVRVQELSLFQFLR